MSNLGPDLGRVWGGSEAGAKSGVDAWSVARSVSGTRSGNGSESGAGSVLRKGPGGI